MIRAAEEIRESLEMTEKKMAEHKANYAKFGWEEGTIEKKNADRTLAYYQGWINALKDALREA